MLSFLLFLADTSGSLSALHHTDGLAQQGLGGNGAGHAYPAVLRASPRQDE